MINPERFLANLIGSGVSYFSGVPDSLLKDLCACITDKVDKNSHTITANEGSAIGLAIGQYLGSGRTSLVYLQNSGLGNIINPLLSLASNEVYGIPMLILVGWRGEPGVSDEPQHVHQGRVMLDMIDSMRIPYKILSSDERESLNQVSDALSNAKEENTPIFLIARKDIFEKYDKKDSTEDENNLSREDAISVLANSISNDSIFVSTTGKASRELYEHRLSNGETHQRDFLTVGGMGHANQIALGLSQSINRNLKVYCIDGDGAAIMHMGSLAIIGQSEAHNLVHIILNNGVHDSVGGQPTAGKNINFCKIALSSGYKYALSINTKDSLSEAIKDISQIEGPVFIEVIVSKGARSNLGRPTSSPHENKNLLMSFIHKD